MIYHVALDDEDKVLAVSQDGNAFPPTARVVETNVQPQIGATGFQDLTIEEPLLQWSWVDPEVPLELVRYRKRRAVTAERERRIAGGLTFETVRYQTRPDDRENIAGAAQLATMAVMAGLGQPGDLRWQHPDVDYAWISEDNTLVPMDAPTVMSFARAAAAHKSACIFIARALKDAVDAAPDREALEAIDISAGWPA